ncbi:MAG: RluA family pseudouridine synthase [Magnetococcales bacterium]|nr:RluA family pseudouridine synthase [Magnetococcales bacterium]
MSSNINETQEIKTVQLSTDKDGLRLDKALCETVTPKLSRAAIQRLIKSGLVFIDGAPVTSIAQKASSMVEYALHIPKPQPTYVVPEQLPLTILFEDSDLIVVNKSYGMVVHPGAGVNSGTLVNALLHHCGDELSGIGGKIRPGIVHRLDKDTSGILVVAKNDTTHQGLAKQFEEHTASRQYLAITKTIPKKAQGVIDAPIGRHPKQRTKMAVNSRGRRAVTHYHVITPSPPFALISCRLETGRTHQIRVHMAHIGTPIFGDQEYGRSYQPAKHWPEEIRETLINFKRQALHAATLGFSHPKNGKTLSFQADPPQDFQNLWTNMKKIPYLNER